MLFNSIDYLLFLIVISTIYFATESRYRWLPLLVGSYFFYMCWHPAYILLIIISTAVDYIASNRMSQPNAEDSARRRWLALSLVSNLGLLFFFKYYNFFTESIASALTSFEIAYRLPKSPFLLPVGISFYTFQTLSYTIDVYRRKLTHESHLGRFALYVSFFPQLVAGPIERASNLLPQFRAEHGIDIPRITSGLRLILWGMFKKVVIADRLANFVNRVYEDPTPHSAATLFLATYFFAFQIYCDFSGYSDIAIGSARILGINLMQNFNLPYFATSIGDFWHRWHISLSTWFRDYVYIPLGGNRVTGALAWARNIIIVFVVSGLWHGANWTFMIWGALHGIYFLIARGFASIGIWDRSRLGETPRRVLQTLLTFHAVVFAWVFFRANSVSDALEIIAKPVTKPFGSLYLGPSALETAVSICLVGMLIAIQFGQFTHRLPFYNSPTQWSWRLRWTAYVSILIAIAALGKTSSDFIYFQF